MIRHRRTRMLARWHTTFRCLRLSYADTKEKPFPCSLCRVRFLRPDVRDKHEKRCYEVNTDKTTKQLGLAEPISIRHHSRSRIACDSCRRKKLKCDNATPCRTCVARNVPCTTSSTSRRPGRPRHDESSSPITDEPGQFEPVQHIQAIPTVYDGVANTIEADSYANVNIGGQIQPRISPDTYLSEDCTLQPDSFPVFNDFATVGLDFMNGLWELPPMVCIPKLHRSRHTN